MNVCMTSSVCWRRSAAVHTGQPMLLLQDANHAIPICLPRSRLYLWAIAREAGAECCDTLDGQFHCGARNDAGVHRPSMANGTRMRMCIQRNSTRQLRKLQTSL